MRIFDSRSQFPARNRKGNYWLFLLLTTALVIISFVLPAKTRASSSLQPMDGNRYEQGQALKAQLEQTPTPTSTLEPTQTPRKHKAVRTPRPTATPIPIPPPTDPVNLNFIIFLGILIVGIVITGVLINRRRLEP